MVYSSNTDLLPFFFVTALASKGVLIPNPIPAGFLELIKQIREITLKASQAPPKTISIEKQPAPEELLPPNQQVPGQRPQTPQPNRPGFQQPVQPQFGFPTDPHQGAPADPFQMNFQAQNWQNPSPPNQQYPGYPQQNMQYPQNTGPGQFPNQFSNPQNTNSPQNDFQAQSPSAQKPKGPGGERPQYYDLVSGQLKDMTESDEEDIKTHFGGI